MANAAEHAAPAAISNTLSLSIVAPSGQVATADDIDQVVAPGLIGEFGVLPGHVPLLAALKAGVLSWSEHGQKQVLAVDKGYLQVGAGNRVIIMVEAALPAAKVDLAVARADQEAQTAIMKAGGEDPVALAVAQERLEWANARLAAAAALTTSDSH
jgi:F-type H+-transporting ATPase subunit epsilon